jgi:hypothetical protein
MLAIFVDDLLEANLVEDSLDRDFSKGLLSVKLKDPL